MPIATVGRLTHSGGLVNLDYTWSVSVGKSYLSGDYNYNSADKFASWMVGLQWSDILMGNDMGFAIDQPMFVASTDKGTPDDGNYAMDCGTNFRSLIILQSPLAFTG